MKRLVLGSSVPVVAANFDCSSLGFSEARDVCDAMVSFSSCSSPSNGNITDCAACASEFKSDVSGIFKNHVTRGDGTRSLLTRHASSLMAAVSSTTENNFEDILSRRLYSLQWELSTFLWLKQNTNIKPPKYFLGDTEMGSRQVILKQLLRVCSPIPNAAIALLGHSEEINAVLDIAPILLEHFPGVQLLLNDISADDYNNHIALQQAAPDRVIISDMHYSETIQGLPDQYFDAVFALDATAAEIVPTWLRSVRYAGLLGGLHFDQSHPQVVNSVRTARENMELFLGDGGAFWFIHEPPDE